MARPAIYRPRRPEASALYQCLEHYWEEFQQAYTPLYESMALLNRIHPPSVFARQRHRNWEQLLKKIYEVDPLA